ncbi:MAG: DUF4476 domain-containing protein [Crocinitomicaceae bacterium]|nr:DUF4476 domain-containing protein [Crocinitomicaceae bacterium]
MKVLRLLAIPFLLVGCVITDDGIALNPPGPQVFVCLNAVTDDEAVEMKNTIQSEAFPDNRMTKAQLLSKERCFQAHRVVIIMSAMTFADNKLEIAKFLYNKTENKNDYELCVDALTFQSDKDELRAYIAAMN